MSLHIHQVRQLLAEKDAAADKARPAERILGFLAGYGGEDFAELLDVAVKALAPAEAEMAAEYAARARNPVRHDFGGWISGPGLDPPDLGGGIGWGAE